MIRMTELQESRPGALPLVVEPIAPLAEARALRVLEAWVSKNRALVEEKLLRHAGILFRGFAVTTAAEFGAFTRALEPSLRSYIGGDSPRKRIAERIYTSTSHPPEDTIPLHNELSYMRDPPRTLFFFCALPAKEGGETPIADCRRVYERMSPRLRDQFATRRVMYIQNLHGGRGLGKSWQETFETAERSEVEEFLRQRSIDFEWKGDGGLRTRSICDAIVQHPKTKELVWFNQSNAWHLDPSTREKLLAIAREDDLPHNALFGDGEPIPSEDLEEVRRVFREEEVVFPWRAGDVLVLDNLLAAHGRRPYRGARQILVAMA